MELTQEQIQEIAKCRMSPAYFIETYCKIKHPMKGIIPFNLFPFQRNALERMVDNRFVIFVKGRQMGMSTLMAAYCVWFACFFTAKQILILANKGQVASNIIKKCKLMLNNIQAVDGSLATWLIPTQMNDNVQSIQLDNASVIEATTTTPNSARSEALSLLIFDEAALIKNNLVEEVWTSARPTLATGGSAVVLSTPKGVGNWFHSMWDKAESGQADGQISFHPVKLHWSLHPDRDVIWAEEEKKSMSVQQFAQEHECSFEKSGNTVIDADTIEWYEKTTVKEPLSKEGFDHNFWVWKEPEFGKNYIISGDVARGDGGDYSAAHVICVEDMEQVAEYKGKVPPGTFGDLLVEIGLRYNKGMIICENNSIGFATIQRVLDAFYPKIYWSKKAEGQLFFDPLNWNLPGPDKIPGFQTTGKNRPIIVNSFQDALREKQFIFHSSRLLDEIKGFVWVNTGTMIRAQAAERMNDDLVIAICIGLFARATTLRLTSTDTLQAYALLDSISIEKGRHSIESSSIQQESLKVGTGQKNPFLIGDQDLSWLVG
jgi:hypothetical protein